MGEEWTGTAGLARFAGLAWLAMSMRAGGVGEINIAF